MNQKVRDQIEEHFRSLIDRAGYNHDGCYNLDTNDPTVASGLGKFLFDYLVGSIYDVEWEGFTDQDVEVIEHLLSDMVEAQKVM